MKHIFHRSFVLIAFVCAVTVVLVLGISIVSGFQTKTDLSDSVVIFGLTGLIILLLFLNISDILSYWIGGKSQAIKTKNIVGIPKRKIYAQLYFNLNILFSISFIIGGLLSIAAANLFSSVSSYFVVRIGCFSVIFAFIFNSLVLNVFSALVLKYKLRHGFMELK